MLSAERVVLNFLQRLCGISTMTWKFVSATRGTKAKIYDTRKTIPGWRELEKYAVRCGGGYNHRMSLGDAVMFKDNHIAELGKNFEPKLKKMVEQARANKNVKFVVVEVDHVPRTDDSRCGYYSAGQYGAVAVETCERVAG
jgi:nicotinate-nucleotide pyrophosphorylase (carboxylating)